LRTDRSSRSQQQQRELAAQQHAQHRAEFMQAVASLASRYGTSLQPVLSTLDLPAPLDGTKLQEQADDAYRLLTQANALKTKTTAEFWHSVRSNVDLRHKLSAFVTLADIALVQVPGSVEEERLFSKLNFIKDERRNRLDEEHLNACLMLATQRMFEFEQFPFMTAITKWSDAKKRRSMPYGQRQQQQQQPITISDSDDDELV